MPTTAPIAFGQDGAQNAEVHNTGEIWCNVLWEGYAGFLSDGAAVNVKEVPKTSAAPPAAAKPQ